MINNFDGGDFLSSTIFENPNISNANSIEVNRPNTNLIVLSDSFGSSADFIENGNEPFSTSTGESTNESSKENKEMNFGNLYTKDVVVRPFFSTKAHIAPNVAIAPRNERWTRYLTKTCTARHG